jgi:hypothetical protein
MAIMLSQKNNGNKNDRSWRKRLLRSIKSKT